jgi:ABC-2 type transport system permease protein
VSRADRVEGWRRIWIVALRELRERGRSRGVLISTAVAVLLVVAAILLPSLITPSTTSSVGLAGTVPPGTAGVLTAQAAAADRTIDVRRFASVAEGERAVRDRGVDVLLVDGTRLEWRGRPDSGLTALLSDAVQAVHVRAEAARLGIPQEQLAQLLVPVALSSRQLGAGVGGSPEALGVAIFVLVALLMAISFYGSFVLTGVVQEKANRVAEVLLARMPARELLSGKVLGIGAVGLAQVAVIAVAAWLTARLAGGAHVPRVPSAVLVGMVAWFLLGYALYSALFAALGATASRMEDAQAASAPVTVLLTVSYLVAVAYVAQNPESGTSVALSFFPPAAPLVMTVRIALGTAPTWQVVVSVLITLAVTAGIVRVAGRVYGGALLHVGGRVPLAQAWRSRTV